MKNQLGKIGRVLASTGAAVPLLGGVLGLVAPSALAVGHSTSAEAVLEEFRANLVSAGRDVDVSRFDALSEERRAELADYFLGKKEVKPEPAASSDDQTVGRDGDFEIVKVFPRAARAVNEISIWGTQWFKFAGILISETKINLSYQNKYAMVDQVLSYSCSVITNNDPTAEITTSKNSAYVSNGDAVAKCDVKVKRGAPTPWGQITWSTSESVQVLKGGNTGRITFNGWE